MILCSTGALLGRANGRDFTLLETFAPQLNCDGYELMIYQDWYRRLSELLAFLHKAGLNIPSVHCEKDIGKNLGLGGKEETAEAFAHFDLNCRIARAAGAKKLVLHLWSGVISDQHIENNLNAYAALEKTARDNGLLLTIENVVCNQRDPMTHLHTLSQRYPEVRFTFDTKNAAFHSQLEALYAPENEWLRQRIAHWHVNDYAGGHMEWDRFLGPVKPIGKGSIDFAPFFRYLKENGSGCDLTVEATAFDQTGANDISMLNGQFALIRERLG
jgi:sugar phosphate isomerase/epimerase